MTNQGTKTYTINPGGSQTIPAGYHNGQGSVTANANQNSGTYTFASGSTGATVDMGVNNTYRYVNASNVYTKGKSDGVSSIPDLKLYFITAGANYGACIKADFFNLYTYITTESGGLFDNYTTFPGSGFIGRNSLTGGTKYTISNLLTATTGSVELSSGNFTLSNS